MDFKKCNRCGSFYLAEGDVCPKCNTKETFELSTFKTYIEENGVEHSINSVSQKTGIAVKHLNRFLNYKGFEEYANTLKSTVSTNTIGKIKKNIRKDKNLS